MAKMTISQARKRLEEAENKIQRVFLSNKGYCMSMKDYTTIANILKKSKKSLLTNR